jgi:hypothetical protein
MSKWQQLILVIGVFILILMPVVFFFSAKSSPHQKLEYYLSQNQANPQERDAYFFALEHPEVLKVLPCYCGCKNEGHKSNYNCFFKESDMVEGGDQFDHHGLHCPMCVDIALQGKAMLNSGSSLKEIRNEIDQFYGSHPHLQSTETPMPNH